MPEAKNQFRAVTRQTQELDFGMLHGQDGLKAQKEGFECRGIRLDAALSPDKASDREQQYGPWKEV